MPTVFKKRDIKSALERKGFVKAEGKHEFYVLMVNGKQSGIQTKLSHGSKIEYSRKVLSFMCKQLGFDNMAELKNFIECPLSKDEYVRILENKNQI